MSTRHGRVRAPGRTLARIAPWACGGLAVLVFANALGNGFALDDTGVLVRNDLTHHIDGVWRAFIAPYWPNGSGQYRPLVISSFSLEWALWGSNPAGFHAVNVLWHALTTVLVFAFLRRWLSLAGSAIAAAIFAVHPVHVEAVANVVGRSELMAATGVLAMLLLHQRRSRWAVLAFAAALLSKEHAMVAPLLAVVCDMSDRGARRRSDPRESPPPSPRWLYAGYGVVAILWSGTVAVLFRDGGFAAVDPLWMAVSAPVRWLTMLGVVPTWLRLWFFPADLSVDYSPQITREWPHNLPLASVGVLIIVSALLLALQTRRNAPVISRALLWMLIATGPVANIILPTGVIVAERTLYLSSVGAAALIALGLEWFALRRYRAAIAVAALLVVAGALRTWTRTPVWESNRSLFLDAAESHPLGSWTHISLARVYSGNGGFSQAATEYERSLALFDRRDDSWAEAIQAAGRAREFARADSLIDASRRRFTGSYLIGVAHGAVALAQHRYSEALRVARAATRSFPDSAATYMLAGFAWAGLGVSDSARWAVDHIRRDHPLRVTGDSLIRALDGRQ